MIVYPTINPVIVQLGPVAVHWYGMMYLLAFVTAYFLLKARYARMLASGKIAVGATWTSESLSDLMFYGALGVMLGGRVGYVLFYEFNKFIANPTWLFRVWEGGMSFHGGYIGVFIAMLLFARKYHKNVFQILDFIIPSVAIGLMFGRIGNFINGELWGRVVTDPSYPLAMVFRHVDMLPRHPSQLYEAFGEGLLLFIIVWIYALKPRPRCAVTGLFLIGYGIARFIIEFFREPDADQGYILFGWMTKGQILTVPMLIVGLALMIWAYRHQIYDWGSKVVNPAPDDSFEPVEKTEIEAK